MDVFWTHGSKNTKTHRHIAQDVSLDQSKCKTQFICDNKPVNTMQHGLHHANILSILNISRRLVTTNRSFISIHGQPCKNFPCIQFDHHEKSGCRFSFCVCTCRGPKIGRCWGSLPFGMRGQPRPTSQRGRG